MANAPLVSVVLPAYNAERFLSEAVRSVRRQTFRHLDIIVVNDGSTDGTGAVAGQLAEEDSRVRVVHTRNAGLSAARNVGIAEARGEFICFLDADDIFLHDKIERQLAFLEALPSCDLVYSDHYLGDELLNPILLECKRPPAPLSELLSYCNWFAPMAALMKTHLLRGVGGFDEELKSAEDWDMWIRAARVAVLAYLPGPVGIYRTHPGQMHRNLARMRVYQDKVIRKHFAHGGKEWHITQAARAWSNAKRAWAASNYVTSAASLATVVWHARSRRTLRKVVQLAY